VRIHADHLVFGGGLEALVGAGGVEALEVDQFLLVEGREIGAIAGAEVTAGAFDPEDWDVLAREGIFLGQFGGGVATSGIGDALVER
jgi:hypothetical protein